MQGWSVNDIAVELGVARSTAWLWVKHLLGAAIYWCEGAKTKPYRPNDFNVSFTNSDPMLVDLFIRFLELKGHRRETLSYRVSIHESADVSAAQECGSSELHYHLSVSSGQL